MVWVMFSASEVCLFFVRLPSPAFISSFSQSPSTKQHVSDGLEIKIRNHLTLWGTERKFNSFMYYNFFILDQYKIFHFLHIDFIDCVWIASFNAISHELQPTFSKMRSGLGFFCFWKVYFWDIAGRAWFSKENLGLAY